MKNSYNYLAIDIETMPNLELVNYLPEVEVNKVLKDPEKIKQDIEQKKQEQIEKMALSPLFGRIACIGLYSVDYKNNNSNNTNNNSNNNNNTNNDNTNNRIYEDCLMSDGTDEKEKELLTNFFNIIETRRIITYNGLNFDLPFIFKRAVYHNIKRLEELKNYTNKYDNFKHLDLMNEFCDFSRYEKLDTLAKIFLNDRKEDFNVKEIPELIKTEEGRNRLKEYCLKDTKLTWDLADRFGYFHCEKLPFED